MGRDGKNRLFDSRMCERFSSCIHKKNFMCLSDDSFETNPMGDYSKKKTSF